MEWKGALTRIRLSWQVILAPATPYFAPTWRKSWASWVVLTVISQRSSIRLSCTWDWPAKVWLINASGWSRHTILNATERQSLAQRGVFYSSVALSTVLLLCLTWSVPAHMTFRSPILITKNSPLTGLSSSSRRSRSGRISMTSGSKLRRRRMWSGTRTLPLIPFQLSKNLWNLYWMSTRSKVPGLNVMSNSHVKKTLHKSTNPARAKWMLTWASSSQST